jgi:hypothetical protein
MKMLNTKHLYHMGGWGRRSPPPAFRMMINCKNKNKQDKWYSI